MVSVKKAELTGVMVRQIREHFGESQKKFAERFDVTQPVIHRLEMKGSETQDGPLIILIKQLADENNIDLGDDDRAEVGSEDLAMAVG